MSAGFRLYPTGQSGTYTYGQSLPLSVAVVGQVKTAPSCLLVQSEHLASVSLAHGTVMTPL